MRIDTGDFTPVMISIDGMPKDYTFQPVYQYGSRAELTEFSSFSELLDTFYRKRISRKICAAAAPISRARRKQHGIVSCAKSRRASRNCSKRKNARNTAAGVISSQRICTA